MGQSRHFEEVWWITDDEGNMLLWGTDKGAFCPLKNPKYRMSGVVRYAAPEYEHLIGRNMYISGEVDLAAVPPEAPGIFRVN